MLTLLDDPAYCHPAARALISQESIKSYGVKNLPRAKEGFHCILRKEDGTWESKPLQEVHPRVEEASPHQRAS